MQKQVIISLLEKIDTNIKRLQQASSSLDDIEFTISDTTGEEIALDWDDSDLEDLQIDVQSAINELQELDSEISSYLT